MLALIRFSALALIKILGMLFYSWETAWLGPVPSDVWQRTRLVVFLNHTSLFEPVYTRLLPFRFIWRLARFAVFPAADKTMERPIAGRFFKLMAPSVIPITRTRDATWTNFLDTLGPESIVMIAPEGRMKRPNGLDKDGKPMTVRGGIAEILALVDDGYMLLAYSGGLHHMQAPGQRFPKLFRRLKMNMEIVSVPDYKKSLGFGDDARAFKLAVIKDLEYRRDRYCPASDSSN